MTIKMAFVKYPAVCLGSLALLLGACAQTGPLTKGEPSLWTFNPASPAPFLASDGDNVLSAKPWLAASNAWGPIERDRSNGEQLSGDGRPLTLNGKVYPRGFGVHAASSMSFAVGGVCNSFTSDIGVDDEVGERGSVVFRVYGDEQKLYDSGVMTGASATRSVNLPIVGVRVLRLVVGATGEGADADHADWAGATLHGCAETLSWATRAAAPTPLYEAQGAVVGAKLYVLGGFDQISGGKPLATARAQVYDPANNSWTRLRDMPEPLTHAGVAADGQTVYVAGGFIGDHPGPQTDHVWKYDVQHDAWTPGPPLPAARGGGALVLLGGELHFFGGTERDPDELHTYRQDFGDHWVLPLSGGGWRSAAPLPNPRNHISGAALGGKIYAVGGQHLGDEAAGNQSEVDVYDPATDSWAKGADLPLPLGHAGASTVVWNGRLVVAGGVTQNPGAAMGAKVANVSEYDPGTGLWTALTPLPAPRQSPVAGVIGGQLVVTTGADLTGPTDTTWLGTR